MTLGRIFAFFAARLLSIRALKDSSIPTLTELEHPLDATRQPAFCLYWGHRLCNEDRAFCGCGQDAADRFCQLKGFPYADSFKARKFWDRKTRSLASDYFWECGPGCRGLSEVVCAAHPGLGTSCAPPEGRIFNRTLYCRAPRFMAFPCQIEQFCRSIGGHLPSLNSKAEASFLAVAFKTRRFNVWTGLFRGRDGGWRWTDSTPVDRRLVPFEKEYLEFLEPDPCLGLACANGGSCEERDDSFFCRCAEGFEGELCEEDVDDCAQVACLHQGTCLDQVNGYSCACLLGWEGRHCEESVNDCREDSCTNGATCEDQHRDFRCQCAPGFTGKRCETDIDECANADCRNNGTCVDRVAGFACQCQEGFTGALCETNVDDCSGVQCLNGGVCEDGVAEFRCACEEGFRGEFCEEDVDDCEEVECQNGGSCVDGVASFGCACAAGFNGRLCERNIDDCLTVECQNGGVCVDGTDVYSCTCRAGFTGVHCEVDIDDCEGVQCLNGGECRDLEDGFQCSCPEGFRGDLCEEDLDECAGAEAQCANGASCVDGVAEFSCECAQGFTGRLCETNIDDCLPDSCSENGRCVDGIAAFSCDCEAGFTGERCEVNIDECTPLPCRNGAQCRDGVNGFDCVCAEGFTGILCEANVDDCKGDPCQNGGTCEDLVAAFRCLCPQGFRGARLRCEEREAPPAASVKAGGGQRRTKCPKGWKRLYRRLGCGKVFLGRVTYSSAAAACRAEGRDTHLGSVLSSADQYSLRRLVRASCLRRTDMLWIGGRRTGDGDGWSWEDGSEWSFAHWLPNEPNGAGKGEHCVQSLAGGKWNDFYCDQTQFIFSPKAYFCVMQLDS